MLSQAEFPYCTQWKWQLPSLGQPAYLEEQRRAQLAWLRRIYTPEKIRVTDCSSGKRDPV